MRPLLKRVHESDGSEDERDFNPFAGTGCKYKKKKFFLSLTHFFFLALKTILKGVKTEERRETFHLKTRNGAETTLVRGTLIKDPKFYLDLKIYD